MDFKIRTTLVAAAVATVLSSTAIATTSQTTQLSLPTQQSLPNFDKNANTTKHATPITKKTKASRATTRTHAKTNNPSLYGKGITQKHTDTHFDRQLNLSTFTWAKGEQQTAGVPYSVVKPETAVKQAVQSHALTMAQKHGVNARSLAEAELKYTHNNGKGAIVSKFQQKVNGIEVYGRQYNVVMNQNMALIATSGHFSTAKAPRQSKAGQFSIAASDAIGKAFANMNGGHVNLTRSQDKANYEVFDATSSSYHFSDQPRSKKVYYPTAKSLVPAYYVEIMASAKGTKDITAYSFIVSAKDGEILARNNLVQSDAFSYRVFADTTAPYVPYDSPVGNELSPHPTGVNSDVITETQAPMNDVSIEHSGISTNDPWLAADATMTKGNNVDAYADIAEPDGFSDGDIRAQTTSDKTFAYDYDMNAAFDTDDNVSAAVVNLFYVNNWLHDMYYDHGFDEAAGNAQMDNYGRGGEGDDPLRAEAQDHGGLNNANMATPADGASPRMQMFIWQDATTRDGTVDNAIIEHEWGHYISSRLTNGGMYANNQGGSLGEGWGDFFALMTMVREEDQALTGNDQWQGVYNDGGFAVNNGFVSEAYYFGLRRYPYTTDMTRNALTFRHIMDQVALPSDTPISPIYTADFHTDGVLNAEVHNAGEIWALSLWEAYAALLNREGLSFSDAQSRMKDYMVAGMKVTPFAPTYTEARDAILSVALANDPADYNVMLAAFAKRGLGVLAQSPDRWDAGFDGTFGSEGHKGTVEDFSTTVSRVGVTAAMLDTHANTPIGAFCDTDDTLDVGETGLVKVSVENTGTEALSGLKAKVTSTGNITFANDGMIDFADLPQWQATASGMVEATLTDAQTNDSIDIMITFMSDNEDVTLPEPISATIKVNLDFSAERETETFDNNQTVWNDWSKTNASGATSDNEHFLTEWSVYEDEDFGYVAFGPDLSSTNDISLISPKLTVAQSGEFEMSFEHYYDFEMSDDINWDGGVVEISIDGGDWLDVTAAGGSFATGYNGTIGPFNPYLADRQGFVALTAAGWIAPEAITFAEGTLNGKEVQFRFRIASDEAVASWGWNIDNLIFFNSVNETPFSNIVAEDAVCVNRSPLVVEISGPDSVIETHELDLVATGFDHDANELSYVWTQTGGSTSIDVSGITGATLHLTAPITAADEVYSFSVVANDGTETSEPQSASFTVIANQAPVVTTTSGGDVREQTSVNLSVTGTDAEGNELTYHWMQGDVEVATSASYTYTAPAVDADQQVVFMVHANDGIEDGEAIPVTVNVLANQAPVVTTTSGGDVREQTLVNLAVAGTDAENDELTYHWMLGDVEVAVGTSYEYTTPAVDADQQVVFMVHAHDGLDSSEAIPVTVNVLANQAPVVTATQASLSVREGDSVTVSVTGSDPEGDEITYTWLQDGQAFAASGASFDFTSPTVTTDTTITFTVTATDGDETSDPVSIAVNVDNRGSGGSMGWLGLLLAPLAFIRRRKNV